MYFIEKNARPISGGGSLPLAPNPRFSATPSAGWLCFFPAAVATLRRSPFPMPATPINESFYVFLRSKKWSLCDQVKTQRASGSLRHARNAQYTEFLCFSARRKMGAFATKQKLEEQAPACDMPATPNIRSFCVFPQGGKCEPSRANKNSKSKRQLATCPQRPSKSKRQLATWSMEMSYKKIKNFKIFVDRNGIR